MTTWARPSSRSEPPVVLQATRTPLRPIVDAYLRHIETFKTPASARVDRWYVRRIFGLDGKGGPYLSAACIEDITPQHVQEFVTATVRRGSLAPKTANRYREVINRLFNWAFRYRGVRMWCNPGAMLERVRERALEITYLTLEHIEAQLCAFADVPVYRTAVAVLVYAGLRRAELLWLTPRDVDLTAGRHGVIRVCAKKVLGDFWEPKTKQNRVVPVSSSLRPILEAYEASADRSRAWYFPSPRGRRWDPENFSRALRRLNRERDLAWNCLDYRHTFGSHLAMRGESLYKISELMGNSPEICRRHYATLQLDSLFDAVEFSDSGRRRAPTEKDLRCS